MEYGFKNTFQHKQQKHGGESKWRMHLKEERIIEKKTLYNSVVFKVLSLHILSCIGTEKYLNIQKNT